ncbi:MAG: Rne/Rng family ribonuclease [Actinobacteria bacterium]|nr:Rne/Rng family ribonuclease [Actinomycetota bacterium]
MPDDNDSEATRTTSDASAPSEPTAPAKSPRKRAAKSVKKAAPPVEPDGRADGGEVSSNDAVNDADAPVARKRAPRKRTAPAISTGDGGLPVDTVAEKAVDGDQSGSAEPAAPVNATKRTRKTVAKKAGPPAETGAETNTQAPEPGSLFDSADVQPSRPKKAAKRSRKAPTASPESRLAPSEAEPGAEVRTDGATDTGTADAGRPALAAPAVLFQAPAAAVDADAAAAPRRRRGRGASSEVAPVPATAAPELSTSSDEPPADDAADVESNDELREVAEAEASGARRRRRRGRRGRGRSRDELDEAGPETEEPGGEDDEAGRDDEAEADVDVDDESEPEAGDEAGAGESTRRRRRRRRRAGAEDADDAGDDPENTVTHVRERRSESGDDGVRGVRGSTRLEAKRQRRREGRESGRRRPSILTEAEFLARRESVERVMAVRERGDRTQIAVVEDGVLVEHYVTRATSTSYVGNVYLGRVQNVLPSMEAAFVDIGKGRNGVLYAGEVNWEAAGLEGKSRAIENALHPGDSILVQVTKDPIGHKGARLTSQVSLPGRYLVFVPGGGMTGISRRLPDTERQRLKTILKKVVPDDAGVIIRTAAEGASEEELTHDVERLSAEWESIKAKAERTSSAPSLVHGEPDLAIRVVRDVFNEDFKQLVVQGERTWDTISTYLSDVAPDLAERASRYTGTGDLFTDLRVDEGLAKALDRKVWLPSGGSLVIDRTEAMTVIDVNTGKFVGSGGNLEQTVTRNNLEAAEEIVRQLRLRDVGGIVVIDFIDMVLESNRDLVLRRLTECLGRDRTKHQVAEVTSLGLVQMTRKRVGEGLLEAFSQTCEVCKGRGVIVHTDPVELRSGGEDAGEENGGRKRGGDEAPRKRGSRSRAKKEAAPVVDAETEERRRLAATAMAAIHRAAHGEEDDVEDDADLLSQLQGIDALPAGGAGAVVVAELSEPVSPEELGGAASVAGLDPADLHVEPAGSSGSPASPDAGWPVERVDERAPAPRRRRRGASRPAGPPVAAS